MKMKMASPLGQGGFGTVTDNLVWVVDPKPHPGAARGGEPHLLELAAHN
jgi:hypothetical protein